MGLALTYVLIGTSDDSPRSMSTFLRCLRETFIYLFVYSQVSAPTTKDLCQVLPDSSLKTTDSETGAMLPCVQYNLIPPLTDHSPNLIFVHCTYIKY